MKLAIEFWWTRFFRWYFSNRCEIPWYFQFFSQKSGHPALSMSFACGTIAPRIHTTATGAGTCNLSQYHNPYRSYILIFMMSMTMSG